MNNNLKYEKYKKIVLEAVNDYNNRNYKDALVKFKKMSEINYQNIKIHEILAYIYVKQNDIEKAEEELNLIKSILNKGSSFDNFSEIENKNDLNFDGNEFLKLEKEYDEILKQTELKNFSKDLEIITTLSNLYMSIKEYKKAEDILENYKKRFFETE